MRTSIGVITVLALLLLSCGEVKRRPGIEGSVVGADGTAPPLAHVHLVGLGDGVSMSIESVVVSDDGSFAIEIPDDRYYGIVVTGVNHMPLHIPMPVDRELSLTGVRVRLAPYDYRSEFDDVMIIGDWNGFSRREPEHMTLQEDGTFIYEREVDGDTLAYQLVNVVTSGRSINGTDSDRYIYDGGGDYISVVSVEGGVATVTFDPQKVRAQSPEGLPSVDFGDEDLPLGEIFEVQLRSETESNERYSAFVQHFREHGTVDGFEYDSSGLRGYLHEKMSGESDPTVRRFAAAKLVGLAEMEVSLTDDEIRAIESLLPLTDGMWAAAPTGLVHVLERLHGTDEMVRLFEGGLDAVAEKKPRAVMLLEIGMKAREMGDTARVNEIFHDLMENYADIDVPMVSYRLRSELDPNLKIGMGMEVPEFEVDLLDGKQVISKKSLMGKYYILDFWATWCGPCVMEMANMHAAYERFNGPNFEIVSLSFDETTNDVAEFRAGKWGMPWLHAYVEGGFGSDLAREFEVSGIPKPILVNPHGVIAATGMYLRGDKLEQTLARHLNR